MTCWMGTVDVDVWVLKDSGDMLNIDVWVFKDSGWTCWMLMFGY